MYVTVNSPKMKTTETYTMTYERLPYYCFSCSLLGHSSLLCPNPCPRDKNGDLPYATKKLCAMDDNPKKSGDSCSTSFDEHASDPKVHSGDSCSSAAGSRSKNHEQPVGVDMESEVSSPLKGGRNTGRGRGQANSSRGKGRSVGSSKELFALKNKKDGMAGQKRKSNRTDRASSPDGQATDPTNALALVIALGVNEDALVNVEVQVGDTNKKQRTAPSRSVDPATAAEQPRQTQ
jgi:hypothetical protein